MYSSQPNFKDSPFNFATSEQIQSGLLSPFQRKLLNAKLKTNLRPEYRRRIEIMLLADGGHSQTQICVALSCSHETARYWTHIAQSGAAHKWQELPIGRPKTINEEYLHRLEELVGKSPRDFGYGFKRWTANWLSKHLAKELGIEVSERHVNRLLKQRGLSTRPAHNVSESSLEVSKESQKNLALGKANIVIRNLQGKKQPQVVSFSPFHLS